MSIPIRQGRESRPPLPSQFLTRGYSMSISARLEQLFTDTAGPNGRPITLQEVIDRMSRGGIATMSLSYLQQLRKGEANNPRLQHLRALADVFDVPLSYFVDADPDEIESPHALGPAGKAMTPAELNVALRVHGLSPEALGSIRSIIELARKGEHLDETPS